MATCRFRVLQMWVSFSLDFLQCFWDFDPEFPLCLYIKNRKISLFGPTKFAIPKRLCILLLEIPDGIYNLEQKLTNYSQWAKNDLPLTSANAFLLGQISIHSFCITL